MSEEHKRANQRARAENKAVGAYLEALGDKPTRRGRRRSPESMQNRLAEIAESMESATPLKRVQLIQERMDIEEAQAVQAKAASVQELIDELETAFVEAVAAYSKRKGISYAAWREMGVKVAVLKKGGITRAAS